MRVRRWAINAAMAGAALVLAGLVLSGLGGVEQTSFGWMASSGFAPVVALGARGLWSALLVLLGVLVLTVAIAWTLGDNARRDDGTSQGS